MLVCVALRDRMEVCSEAEYAAVIEREMARADRNGHSFSIIVFTFKTQRHAKNALSFVQQLRARFRSYDEIGWFAADQIGVLLPYLDAQQATVLAEEIRADHVHGQMISEIAVFTYPRHWLNGAAGFHASSVGSDTQGNLVPAGSGKYVCSTEISALFFSLCRWRNACSMFSGRCRG